MRDREREAASVRGKERVRERASVRDKEREKGSIGES